MPQPKYRSGFTQSTDEFFFTASNQIVNDLRSPSPASFDYRNRRQASKPVSTTASAHGRLRLRIIRTLKRTTQEGRIPLRAVARTEFCYHSLQGTFFFVPPSPLHKQLLRKACDSSDPQFGDLFRIPESGPGAQVLLPKKIPEFSAELPGSLQRIINKWFIDLATGRLRPH